MVCVYLRNYLRRYSAAVGPVVRVKATFHLPYLWTVLTVLKRNELRRMQMVSRVSAGAKRLFRTFGEGILSTPVEIGSSALLVKESEAVRGKRRRGG